MFSNTALKKDNCLKYFQNKREHCLKVGTKQMTINLWERKVAICPKVLLILLLWVHN